MDIKLSRKGFILHYADLVHTTISIGNSIERIFVHYSRGIQGRVLVIICVNVCTILAICGEVFPEYLIRCDGI